jgi:hypothetical protein
MLYRQNGFALSSQSLHRMVSDRGASTHLATTLEVVEWSVLVEAGAPQGSATLDVDHEVLDQFLDLVNEWDGSVSAGGAMWSARIVVEASDVSRAVERACSLVRSAGVRAGMPNWPVRQVDATEWNRFEDELGRSA